MGKKWDERWMQMAYVLSTFSEDTSTHIGAVIVGPDHEIRSTGYNGLPRGIENTPERNERPLKYSYFEHGERNAIFNAARMGTPVKGCTMYTNGVPCTDCMRAILQSGITRLVTHKEWDLDPYSVHQVWAESLKQTMLMIDEAKKGGFVHDVYVGKLELAFTPLKGGKKLDSLFQHSR
jgi:dCMP deaminase